MTHFIKDSALPDCRYCKNTRIIHGGDLVYQCQCSRKGVPLMRFFDTTIGRMYHGANLNAMTPMDAQQEQLIGHAQRFVNWYESGKKGLYLWSKQAGNDKSLIASAIINAIGLPIAANIGLVTTASLVGALVWAQAVAGVFNYTVGA